MPETFAREDRLAKLRSSQMNGVEDVEVAPDGRTLVVRFFHDAPHSLSRRHVRVTGGVAIREINVVDVRLLDSDDPDLPTLAEVSVDRTGDESVYTLETLDLEHFDPRYRSAAFNFFPDWDREVDCVSYPSHASSTVATPSINYLAKDYAGFRQLILDRLALTLPTWSERHVPDVAIMLVELLAYTADRLSYYQDAVATEAYLGTARRRLSVRRHCRLIDYAVHNGATARALVQVDPGADAKLELADAVFCVGRDDDRVEFRPLATGRANADLRRANVAIPFHCWGNTGCVLRRGSTSATLVDLDPDAPESLRSGDFLILEVVDTHLGDAPDPDLTLRHPVRLTRVRRSYDTLLGVPLLEVRWSAEDATRIDFPLDAPPGGDGRRTVARGDLVLVGQGRMVVEGNHAMGKLRTIEVGPGRRRTLTLTTPGLAFAAPVGLHDSANKVLYGQDPRAAQPVVDRLTGWPVNSDGQPTAGAALAWLVRPDLIESGPTDAHAMVEVDDDGVATLRFGDGVCGRDPSGFGFEVGYHVMVGASGDVGADRIDGLHDPGQPDGSGWKVRNPLAASGGAAPEDVAQVRLMAPHAFRDTRVRAVTAEDYARLAENLEPQVQRATCDLVRCGVRWTARVAIDPFGTDEPDDDLVQRVAVALESYRHIGHDITVVQGEYTPLLVVLRVEVAKGFSRGRLRAALCEALGSGVTSDGGLAPFNPDRLGFGTPIYGSPLIAAARAVAGVRDVRIVELARMFDRERGSYADGVLAMTWNEIPRLDNDPLHPEKGRLELRLEGGSP